MPVSGSKVIASGRGTEEMYVKLEKPEDAGEIEISWTYRFFRFGGDYTSRM